MNDGTAGRGATTSPEPGADPGGAAVDELGGAVVDELGGVVVEELGGVVVEELGGTVVEEALAGSGAVSAKKPCASVWKSARSGRSFIAGSSSSFRSRENCSAATILAAGYAVFLLVAAGVLEWLSVHTHRRSLRYRTAGFEYDAEHDHWRCPEGQYLWPDEVDHERRLLRYRAKAHICNGCALKDACTDSDQGREIVRPLDPWPHSEAGRFHRAVSLVLVGVALLVLVAGAVRNHARQRRSRYWRCSSWRSSSAGGWHATCARIRRTSPNRPPRTAYASQISTSRCSSA